MDTRCYPCLGAIIGDTVGSIYEFENIKTNDFPFFSRKSDYTDDSIMTIAVADWLATTDRSQAALENILVDWAEHNPCPMGGYGDSFRRWLFQPEALFWFDETGSMHHFADGKRHPYNSCGNGSAMRVSACGWVTNTLDEALDLGQRSAEITHSHPDGIKGAQAVATAIFLARRGESKDTIRRYMEQQFAYELNTTCDAIRPYYDWDGTCQGTVPQAIFAWLPVETIVKQNQQEYYHAIARSDSAGDSTVFILFMLKCLQATIKHEVENKVEGKVEDKSLTDSEQRIVRLMTKDAYITIAEICKKTKLSAAGVNKILASLRNKGIIKRIGANKNGYWDVHKK